MRRIVPRKLSFDFDVKDIPHHWLGGPITTHMANTLNLVFPNGERFFVRSVRYYLKEIEKDPALLERVRAFCAQEGHHAHAHECFFEILRAQGYDIERFLAIDSRSQRRFESMLRPIMRLSVTVALEHYTAMFAESALTRDFLDSAPPVMRQLLKWHAAEEIEHKDVAFDVLKQIDPSYYTRIMGLVLATLGLMIFWTIGTVMLTRQEELSRLDVLKQLAQDIGQRRILKGDMPRSFFAYLKPSFHPTEIANFELAERYLNAIGAA